MQNTNKNFFCEKIVLFIWGDAYNYTEYKILTAVISIAQHLINKGDHATLYTINKNVYIKTAEIIIIQS